MSVSFVELLCESRSTADKQIKNKDVLLEEGFHYLEIGSWGGLVAKSEEKSECISWRKNFLSRGGKSMCQGPEMGLGYSNREQQVSHCCRRLRLL